MPRRPYQVKLPVAEADAFDELVRRRAAEAEAVGGTANASRVLHALIRKELAAEGLLPAPEAPKAARSSAAKGKVAR